MKAPLAQTWDRGLRRMPRKSGGRWRLPRGDRQWCTSTVLQELCPQVHRCRAQKARAGDPLYRAQSRNR